MPIREGYLTTDDGVRLFFQTVGDGPEVVIPNGIPLINDLRPLARGRTLILYDVRNRGRSESLADESKLAMGIQHDVDDLDVVRRHFALSQIALLGHSYVGLTVVLYAMKFPASVSRIVQIGAVQPDSRKQYAAHLTNVDATLANVLSTLGQMQAEPHSGTAEERCQKMWSVLRAIYVADPADAHRIAWARCDLPNERQFMTYWTERLLPSIQRVALTADDFARVRAPVLTVHGTKDRSAPYGGGMDWAALLPNARLVTIDNAAHAPWIEDPDTVFGSIATFLDGEWP